LFFTRKASTVKHMLSALGSGWPCENTIDRQGHEFF